MFFSNKFLMSFLNYSKLPIKSRNFMNYIKKCQMKLKIC